MKPHSVPVEVRDKIIELRERNWGLEAIAEELGVSRGSVTHWVLVRGAEAKRIPPPMPRLVGPFRRKGGLIWPFTEAEDNALLVLERQGLNYSAMAREMLRMFPDRPRQPPTLKYRLLTLARYEERYGGRPQPRETRAAA